MKQREKEEAFTKLLQLEKQLHDKQELELEIEQLNGTLKVMKHLEGEGDETDQAIHEKMSQLSEKLELEKKRLEELSGDLIKKERQRNDELQDSRKELIAVRAYSSSLPFCRTSFKKYETGCSCKNV
jgi:hypothetical protein